MEEQKIWIFCSFCVMIEEKRRIAGKYGGGHQRRKKENIYDAERRIKNIY